MRNKNMVFKASQVKNTCHWQLEELSLVVRDFLKLKENNLALRYV